MENALEIISVPVIVTIVYGMMELLKNAFGSERFNKFIPLLAVIFGALLGFIAYYVYPAIIPAENAFTAILIGAASGWAATGANQTYKKLTSGKSDGEEVGNVDDE